MEKPCKKCGSTDFGYWTSASSGKAQRYCRKCRQNRAKLYADRKIINGGSHSKTEWLDKLKKYDKCPRCERYWCDIPRRPDKRYKFVWTKDHIIPLNFGGSDNIENIQPLCYQCNSSKCDSLEKITENQ